MWCSGECWTSDRDTQVQIPTWQRNSLPNLLPTRGMGETMHAALSSLKEGKGTGVLNNKYIFLSPSWVLTTPEINAYGREVCTNGEFRRCSQLRSIVTTKYIPAVLP